MSEQTTTPADPLGSGDPTQTPPSATASADAPTSDSVAAPAADPTDTDMAQLLAVLREQESAIAQLQRDLAARGPVSNPTATIASTAPASGPAPAAFDNAAPGHAMLAADAELEAGDVVRFNVAANNGGDPLTGYGLILDAADVADRDDNGKTTGSTHPEYVVARLDVLGVRLRADQIVDEDASGQVHEQLTANG